MRTPLPVLSAEEKARRQLAAGLDSENIRLDFTPAERLAARDPGLPARAQEQHMETKPGWKTSEYWLKLLVVLVVLPVLVFFGGAESPIPEMLEALKSGGAVGALVALLAAKGVPAFIAWLASRLAEKYGQQRAQLKQAFLERTPPLPPR